MTNFTLLNLNISEDSWPIFINLCVASLIGIGKGCIRLWGRLDQNPGLHDIRKPPLTYNRGWSRWFGLMCIQLVIRRSAVRSLLVWQWNIFIGHSLSSADSRRAAVSFWRKNVHKYWLIALRTKPVQGKVWLGNLVTLDMMQLSWISHKTSIKPKLVRKMMSPPFFTCVLV